jgi:hypothetical protein
MSAIESASVKQDIEPFSTFMGELVAAAVSGKPKAKI